MNLRTVSSLLLISLLGAMSPGPDFAVVVRNSLSGSFKSGFLTALGIAAALAIHVSYCLLGIAILIVENRLLFHLLQYGGSAYLIYLGIVLLKENPSTEVTSQEKPSKKGSSPFLSGFLCNLLNPKATLFILSLFTQFIQPGMPLFDKLSLGFLFILTALIWFIFLTYLITHRLFRTHFGKFQRFISKIMGIALCGLGLYIALQL